MQDNYEKNKQIIQAAKNNAKIFLPVWDVRLEEFLDIFVVFNKKEKVKKFMRYFISKLVNKSEELNQEGKPPLGYFDKRTKNLAVDYGAFLNYLTEWIAESNHIEKEKVKNYVYYYFGLSYSINYNYPAAVLIKILFSKIFFVFKVFDKGEITKYLTYPVFLSSKNMKYYKLNCLFIHTNYLEKIFEFDELISIENRLNNLDYSNIDKEKIEDFSIYKVFKDTKLDTFQNIKRENSDSK